MTISELREKKQELLANKNYVSISCNKRVGELPDYDISDPITLNEILKKMDASSAIYEIQKKIEEIMIFLVENNIDFDAITLFNIDCCVVREENEDDLFDTDMECMDQLIDASKIAPNILPLTLYYKELADDSREAPDDVDFLNGDLCITAIYAEFDKFISNMHSYGYELLYINPDTGAKLDVSSDEIFSKYLLMIKNGYQLAIRATFPKQDINRTLKI